MSRRERAETSVAPCQRSYPRHWDNAELFPLKEAPRPLNNFWAAYRAHTRGTKRGNVRIKLRVMRGPSSLLTCRQWIWDYLAALSDDPPVKAEPRDYTSVERELVASGL